MTAIKIAKNIGNGFLATSKTLFFSASEKFRSEKMTKGKNKTKKTVVT